MLMLTTTTTPMMRSTIELCMCIVHCACDTKQFIPKRKIVETEQTFHLNRGWAAMRGIQFFPQSLLRFFLFSFAPEHDVRGVFFVECTHTWIY